MTWLGSAFVAGDGTGAAHGSFGGVGGGTGPPPIILAPWFGVFIGRSFMGAGERGLLWTGAAASTGLGTGAEDVTGGVETADGPASVMSRGSSHEELRTSAIGPVSRVMNF